MLCLRKGNCRDGGSWAVFIVIKSVAFLLFGLLAWCLLGRFGRIAGEFIQKAPGKKLLKGLRLGLSIVTGLLCTKTSNGVILVLAHLWVFGLLLDGITRLLGRFFAFPRSRAWRLGAQFILPIAITAALLIYGWINIGRVQQTSYTLTTEKPIRQEGYRVAFLSDLHYGTIQDPSLLPSYVNQINALQPDIIVLGGDIVEEGTSKEAMQEVFAQLGRLQAPLGVYFIYGNHDRHMVPISGAYSDAELANVIESNGIRILEDEALLINGEIFLIGRADASGPRADIAALAQNAPENAYVISLDHQPGETKQSNAAGVDLTLSGHTHAGQIFPAGYVIGLFGGMPYGLYQNGSCVSIVSSGFAGWGFPIRTQGVCEYVIVDIFTK